MFNTINISKTQEPKNTNIFKLTVIWSHEDCDNYTTDTFDFTQGQEDQLLAHVNFLSLCADKYPNEMGTSDGYWDIPGYEKFVDWIPYNNENCDGDATLELFKVLWVDGSGNEFRVTFEE